ncbi:MAG: 50S ribosomal protein L6 [Berkelbacteria bacterium GW2011_GWB1_38_5]|uniref:Large ribosomal subunit protein uL6 n=2 Tax=Candidatus Berkelbacteria TaxID=1618330 RepID=A0A0G0LGE7_9BACT|nr:MAG: 50S ribosomal protein L6 [Berkelbacteria bacterium GW2011_GWB1_38_5]KKQ90963.1 MAG: 50S ribosomal protein L6 [Berkelbacteria bacterium GW2011_GWA1_39_10]
MSKIGQRKIIIPENTQVTINNDEVRAKGPLGELSLKFPKNVAVKIEGLEIAVSRARNDKFSKALHGLFRKLIFNIVTGVSIGFQKKLEFKGVGYRAEVQGNKLILNVGFSHTVEQVAPEGIEFKVEKNIITVSGIDNQKVGQAAANIRRVRPVEPYKGKGIKYIDEIPRRKPGKAAKAALGTAQ